jgi:hypothetical protein
VDKTRTTVKTRTCPFNFAGDPSLPHHDYRLGTPHVWTDFGENPFQSPVTGLGRGFCQTCAGFVH